MSNEQSNEQKIIKCLEKNDNINYSELSQCSGIDIKNIGRYVNKLFKKGIVFLIIDEVDKRNKYVCLEKDYKEKLDKISKKPATQKPATQKTTGKKSSNITSLDVKEFMNTIKLLRKIGAKIPFRDVDAKAFGMKKGMDLRAVFNNQLDDLLKMILLGGN